MSIENAARDVAHYFGFQNGAAKDVELIIRRHLFPVVKPEEVTDGFYWVKCPGHPWAIRQPWIHKDSEESPSETLMFYTYPAREGEIRGPVPMPE